MSVVLTKSITRETTVEVPSTTSKEGKSKLMLRLNSEDQTVELFLKKHRHSNRKIGVAELYAILCKKAEEAELDLAVAESDGETLDGGNFDWEGGDDDSTS
jgi:5,10-methylene-tetrahydrofolate dehydrogenase/methenyl tetrahydrofolate cyclohydrolase